MDILYRRGRATAAEVMGELFASFGLAETVTRLGTLIEENTLAGIGAQNSRNLFSSAGYFAAVPTASGRAFAQRYAQAYGDKGGLLNALAESCYEGMLLLEAMARKAGGVNARKIEAVADGLLYQGPRGAAAMQSRHVRKDIYLAQADGAAFKVIRTFQSVNPGQNCKA